MKQNLRSTIQHQRPRRQTCSRCGMLGPAQCRVCEWELAGRSVHLAPPPSREPVYSTTLSHSELPAPTEREPKFLSGADYRLERKLGKGFGSLHHQPKRPTRGDVYFIQAGTAIKIGYSTDISRRIDSIQTSLPVDLKLLMTLPGGAEREARMHQIFKPHRLRGEWYRAEPVLKWIEENAA